MEEIPLSFKKLVELNGEIQEQKWPDLTRHIVFCDAGTIFVDILSPSKAYIWGLYVDELFRNKGIGKELIDIGLQIAKEQGMELVEIEYEKETPIWVFKWYLRLGFTECVFGMNAVILTKKL